MELSDRPSERLRRLGLVLPGVPPAVGRFSHGKIEGGLVFLSGQGPVMEDGRLARGKVGADVSPDDARHHAMRSGLVLLSALELVIGDLDRVSSVLKLLGFVNATPEFERHPFVIDGCSELFMQVFGERGHHARSAVGVSSLPGGITVELEAVVALSSSS
jgi:enamine deaminase RidA (YjgF/YER057c/UK114 family)